MNAIAQLLPTDHAVADATLLRAAIDACLVSLAVVENGRLLYANQAFAQMFGYRQGSEVQDRALAEFVPGGRACTRLSPETGQAERTNVCGYPACEFNYTRQDGTEIRVQASCASFRADGHDLLIMSAGDISQRERRRVVRASDKRFRAIFDAAAIGIIQCTTDGRVVESNPAVERMLGYSRPELRGMHFHDLTHPQDLATDLSLFEEIVTGVRDYYQVELRYVAKSKSTVWVRLTVSLVRGPDTNPEFVIGMVEDITERKRAEEQLRESHKMEAIGRLVGGVAHDFNNLLTGIMLYCDLLLAGLEAQSRLRHHAEEIRMAGEHGAALIQQLLAVARQRTVEPRVLSMNDVVAGMRNLMARLIGENIELVTLLGDDLWPIKIDPAQAQQIVLNLVLNARDAMPDGGRITLRTRNLQAPPAVGNEVPPQFIEFIVTDTGCGMDAETRSHLFQAFFTTKGPGQGNGLGLATVHDIVQQGRGAIEVDSEPGRGTRVSVRLPRVNAEREAQPASLPAPSRNRRETVLLVEDNSAVRSSICRVLAHDGYTVLEAAAGLEALRVCHDHAGQIDLLIADLIMPGMDGREVARQIRLLRPQARVLYTSGYNHGGGKEVGLFRKPFTGSSLLKRVREILDEPCPQT